ncbi:hypothetical protein LJR220_003232 [Bradyrhizobium sp. LjRoot220]|uniref:hypothetical protein n=1 Tax=Bradyrhizobium sp. LjRoot220 TaxID=3342284 RepID=UPI003ED12229
MSDLLGSLTRGREAIFGAVFATFITPHSAIVLLFGLAGLPGHGLFTGLFLSLTTVLVWCSTVRRDFAISALDYLFAAFVAVVVGSVLSNGMTAEPKEFVLLILALSAYPACRFIRPGDLTRGSDAFVGVLSVLVLIGAAVTLGTLVEQWNGFRSKPIILGFDAAPIYFLQSLSYLIFAVLMMRQLTAFRTLMLSLLLMIPLAVFAASFVRFMFVALVATLMVAVVSSGTWRRNNILIVIAAIVLSIAAGLSSRSEHIARYATYAIGGDQTAPVAAPPAGAPAQKANQGAGPQLEPAGQPAQQAVPQQAQPLGPQNLAPSCSSDANVNVDNSIAIRKVLLRDMAFMLPGAGLFGHGLDAFMRVSCMKGHQVHNSALQALVEFGWLGGILFSALLATSLWSITRAAKRDGASRFVFCCLIFVVLLCLAHGRLSREAALFAWIGVVAGVTQRARSPATQPADSCVSRCP